MAEVLALFAAFLFAVAATFQQKGALRLGLSADSLRSFARLVRSYWWLFGTVALFVGYIVQAIALDHGRLAIIQPLLVTTVVFALPLGYFFTHQPVGSREVVGAAIVVAGLALFAILWIYSSKPRPVGAVSGAFLAGYGAFRFIAEFARQPDDFLGLLSLGLSMGQWLSLPMIVAGVAMMAWAYKKKPLATSH